MDSACPIIIDGGFRLAGAAGLDSANQIYGTLLRAQPKNGELIVDLGSATELDAPVVAAIAAGCRAHERHAVAIRLTGSPASRLSVEQAMADGEAPPCPAPRSVVESLGQSTLQQLTAARAVASMTAQAAVALGRIASRQARLPRMALGKTVATMGADAVGIVMLLSALLGMILTFEASEQLGALGAKPLIPDVVGLSLIREFAPLLVAVVVIARNGAAIASELASMSANQELDALRTMGIDPVQYLVVPRGLGLLLTTPVLTLMGVFVGLAGATIIAVGVAQLEVALFYRRLVEAVTLGDLAYGLAKSAVFAVTTVLAAAAIGMGISRSASDVGRATTQAVVLGILMLVLCDAAFTFVSGVPVD